MLVKVMCSGFDFFRNAGMARWSDFATSKTRPPLHDSISFQFAHQNFLDARYVDAASVATFTRSFYLEYQSDGTATNESFVMSNYKMPEIPLPGQEEILRRQ